MAGRGPGIASFPGERDGMLLRLRGHVPSRSGAPACSPEFSLRRKTAELMNMRYSALNTGVLALAISGCATVGLMGNRAEERRERGLAAVERGDFPAAVDDLGWVAQNHHGDAMG